MTKISDINLLEEFENGKTLKEIAKEYGYGKGGKQNLSKRLKKLKNYPGRKSAKLTKKSNSRVISIPNWLIERAGFDPEKELRAERKSGDGKIILKLEIDKND